VIVYGGLGGGALTGDLLVAGAAAAGAPTPPLYNPASQLLAARGRRLHDADSRGLAVSPFASSTSCGWMGAA
jgi:hypothetical protein